MCTAAILLMCATLIHAQKKQEQEFRIEKSQLPQALISQIEAHLVRVKRPRYYKEIDGEKTSFEVKFKKNQRFYSIEFDEQGVLEDIEFIIKADEISQPVFTTIRIHFKNTYGKYHIKKLQRQYPNTGDAFDDLLQNAFQNLPLPSVHYEIIISTKEKTGYATYEILFDAKGNHLLTRKVVNVNYDHVLYQ